jgi:hypothetical protein
MMTTHKPPAKPGSHKLNEALRANLRRRKVQMAERGAAELPESDGDSGVRYSGFAARANPQAVKPQDAD